MASAAAARGPSAGATVTVASCPASSAHSCPSGCACGGSEASMPSRPSTARTRGSSLVPARRVHQQQVEPVAHAEPVQAGLDRAARPGPGRRRRRRTAPRRRRRGPSCAPRAAAASAASARVLSPLPRRITSGIRPGWLTSARAESWPGTRTSWIMAGSSPAAARAGAMTSSASATAERIAAEPVRSTPALRDLTNWEAMSTTTFGPGLEVGPDHADRAAPLVQRQAAGQLADRPSVRLGRDVGQRAELAGDGLEPGLVQPEPVEQPAAEAGLAARRHVRLVGREHRGGLAAEGVGHRAQRLVEPLVRDAGQVGDGVAGGPGGLLHGLHGVSALSAVIASWSSARRSRRSAPGYAVRVAQGRRLQRAVELLRGGFRAPGPGRVADGERGQHAAGGAERRRYHRRRLKPWPSSAGCR